MEKKYEDVRDFLLHGTDVGDVIKFTQGGWQVGITQIDDEDLFTRSINMEMLNCKHFRVSKDNIYIKNQVIPATRIELDVF